MKHSKPPLTIAEQYAKAYNMPIETIERLIMIGAIR